MASPSLSHSQSENQFGKRASRACDRCRLKKVKCSGSTPCLRCMSDDAVCGVQARRKADAMPISMTRASEIQLHQHLYIKAIKILWRKLSDAQSIGQAPSQEQDPSIHTILQRLGLLEELQDPPEVGKEIDSWAQELEMSFSGEEEVALEDGNPWVLGESFEDMLNHQHIDFIDDESVPSRLTWDTNPLSSSSLPEYETFNSVAQS